MKYQTKIAGVILFVITLISAAQSPTKDPADDPGGRQTQTRGYWVDTSGLMWAGKDNGKDISWKKATKYCQNLRLAGYSDWRLAKIWELFAIYEANFETPGLIGPGKGRDFIWHVRGRLLLSGNEWSSSRGHDERGRPSGTALYFNFSEGKWYKDVLGYDSSKRALCARHTSK